MSIRLSELQRRAVEFGEGPLLVVAGPGSGKTRVLTERIRRLLSHDTGHFHILALTFTNKAANEMRERLADVPEVSKRTFIGTFHSFCADVLAQKGASVGIEGLPQIFESFQDRKALLLQAVNEDPELLHELKAAGDQQQQSRRLDNWLRRVAVYKNRLTDISGVDDRFDQRIYEVYDAALRASGGVDFDDLLLLTYRLLVERPKIAGFYRRLYKYICLDEAQDLNQAQYGVLSALCSNEQRNVMMVGDPEQSIFGFNYAGPEFMDTFKRDFQATQIELTENFRSSQAVVHAAQSLNKDYQIVGTLPIKGEIELQVATDEDHEANLVIEKLKELIEHGHSDVEGQVTLQRAAVLARTRYALLPLERLLRELDWPYFKQVKTGHESESELVRGFEACLRLLVNPRDRVHFDVLRKSWHAEVMTIDPNSNSTGLRIIGMLGEVAKRKVEAEVVLNAVTPLAQEANIIPMNQAFQVLQAYADKMDDNERRLIREDVEVLRDEWDRYLRAGVGGSSDLGAFLTHMALGTTQQFRRDGLALLTIHSSKGLEFDVVFIVGMADGVFPDYRSKKSRATSAEERRNAFVAVARSRRLLYCSYSQTRKTPWGDVWAQNPSIYLFDMGLLRE